MAEENKVVPAENIEQEDSLDDQIDENGDQKVSRITREMMFAMSSMSGSSLHPKIAEKLNENHIDKIIDQSENHDRRVYELFQGSRKDNKLYFLVSVAFIIFLTVFLILTDHQNLYVEIFKIIIYGGAGFLGGWGFGKKKKD